MGHRTDLYVGASHLEVVGVDIVQTVVATKLIEADGKIRWPYETRKQILDGRARVTRTIDVETRTNAIRGGEERESLNMVEMEVRDERGRRERPVERLRLSPTLQAGSQIQNNGVFPRYLDDHT